MGSSMSVVAANCFMSRFLEQFFRDHPSWSNLIPMLGRLLDDIMGFWSGSRSQFETFLTGLNAWSNAKGWNVVFEESGYGAPLDFLDVTLYYHRGWHTKVYSKPTDVHAYLPYNSAHAKHIVRNIPRIVAVRLRKICSEDEEYHRACGTICVIL